MTTQLENFWQQYKEQFKLPAKLHKEKYKWPVLKQVYDRWDWSKENKAEMFKKAFEVAGSKNLWNSGNFYPINHTNWMFYMFPQETEQAFMVLFDESKALKDRITQFVALYDAKLPDLNNEIEAKEIRNHYHGDRRAIALYLSLQYPEKYFLYKFSMNRDFCQKIGIERPIKGRSENIFNFFDIANNVLEFIKNDTVFIDEYHQFATNQNYSDLSLHLLTQDFIYSTASYFDLQSQSNHIIMKKKTVPLNQILFGPPGTGKTYNSINHALSIIEEISIDDIKKRDRKTNLSKIEDYKELGVVEFVTFHQSYGYEEFIEGIKPILESGEDQNSGSLEYEIKDGIFKSICSNAEAYTEFEEVSRSSHFIQESDIKGKKVFKISLGNTLGDSGEVIYNYCRENNYIALGWGGDVDYTGVNSRQDVLKRFNTAGNTSKPMDFNISAIERFAIWMKKGDLVFVSHGNKMLKAVGVITGDYEFKANVNNPIPGYNHFRKVEWLLLDQRIPVKKAYKKNFSQQSIYALWPNEIKTDFFTQKVKVQSDKTKNHVIIIDEINRGNVSAVFGELITLIEDDKRIGASNELRATLPYSGQKFGVPKNLYIIGTMNTADRSVEALDTALRRRFSFSEMRPQPNLISPSAMICRLLWKYEKVDWEKEPYLSKEIELFEFVGVSDELEAEKKDIWEQMKKDKDMSRLDYFEKFNFDGINLQLLLEVMNKRIELLLDRDHTIGHSYFINVFSIDNLRYVFQDKIIPLLQEYFYGNYSKIELIIGSAFFEVTKINDINFAALLSDISIDNGIMNIKIPYSNDEFEDAIQLLIEGVK